MDTRIRVSTEIFPPDPGEENYPAAGTQTSDLSIMSLLLYYWAIPALLITAPVCLPKKGNLWTQNFFFFLSSFFSFFLHVSLTQHVHIRVNMSPGERKLCSVIYGPTCYWNFKNEAVHSGTCTLHAFISMCNYSHFVNYSTDPQLNLTPDLDDLAYSLMFSLRNGPFYCHTVSNQFQVFNSAICCS